MYAWINIASIINMWLLNVPLLFCWIMLTGGWKKYGTYNCADKLAKCILILCALTYSLTTAACLIISMCKWWATSSSSEYTDFERLHGRVQKFDLYMRFFYSCLISLVAMWAYCDTHKNVEKLAVGGGKLKTLFMLWTFAMLWYTVSNFMNLIYIYDDNADTGTGSWAWNSA